MFKIYHYPLRPSSFNIFGKPSLNVEGKPGLVCILTLTASNGAKPISAKNSALALAAKYNEVRQRKAFSFLKMRI
jgi:hypothetical protein